MRLYEIAQLLRGKFVAFEVGQKGSLPPDVLSRYFGLKSFSTLYGFTWPAYAVAGALGPIVMGCAFDATGSYRTLLMQLSVVTLVAASPLLLLPPYRSRANKSY